CDDRDVLNALVDGLGAAEKLPERLEAELWRLAERTGRDARAAGDTRAAAIRALRRARAMPREKVLLDALGDDEYQVPKAAIEWLGSLQEKAPIEALVTMVRKLEGKDGYGELYGA